MTTVTQTMLYRQALIKYSLKYGVTKAAIRYKINRQYIYRWQKRYDGTLQSLADKSHRPHHHPNELQNTLKLMKQDYLERKLKYGKAFVDSGYIITNEDGKDKSVATISTIYQRLIQSMPEGFPQYGLHCLRHTYTTFLVTSPNGNTDIKSISELLGHSSTQFTLNVYTHSALERKRQATANLDMLVKKSS